MRARLLFAAVFALLCAPVFFLPADPVLLETQAMRGLLAEDWTPPEDAPWVEIVWPGPVDRLGDKRDALRAALQVPRDAPIEEVTADVLRAPLAADAEGAGVRLTAEAAQGRLRLLDDAGEPVAVAVLGSWLSLVPPLAAILLAFLTRATLVSLGIGVLVGVGLMMGPGDGALHYFHVLFVEVLWDILSSAFHLYILGFVLLLSSTVAVVTRMGGIEGMVRKLVRFAHNSRSVQAVAYFMGLGIFFDDYANTIIVGNSCGPLFDKLRISRAKLAYIVDSTAAPVAGVAVLSTWVAYQISTYAPQLPTVGMEPSAGYALFLETIPYRFYCLFALITVALFILLQRDFGPMRRVEEHARAGGAGADDTAIDDEAVQPAPGATPRWINGVLPIVVMIGGTAALIYAYGAATLHQQAAGGDAAAQLAADAGGMTWLRAVLGASDSTKAIFYGSLAALAVAALLALGQRLLPPREVATTATRGLAALLKDAVAVLILAWSIGAVCQGVGTANYLVAVFQDLMAPQWLPMILFVTACFVAFATGSSWTTMAILQPNVVLLAWQLGEQSALGGHGLLVLSIGAVLEGAIFGDHCSPISDTTVLSSTASRCKHIDHVRTQAPYAVTTAAVAMACGYLPVALFDAPWWAGLAVGTLVLAAIVRFGGRRTLASAAPMTEAAG